MGCLAGTSAKAVDRPSEKAAPGVGWEGLAQEASPHLPPPSPNFPAAWGVVTSRGCRHARVAHSWHACHWHRCCQKHGHVLETCLMAGSSLPRPVRALIFCLVLGACLHPGSAQEPVSPSVPTPPAPKLAEAQAKAVAWIIAHQSQAGFLSDMPDDKKALRRSPPTVPMS